MSKEFKFKCFRCKKTMKEPGALLFSPPCLPSGEDTCDVIKFHICQSCYTTLFYFLVLPSDEVL